MRLTADKTGDVLVVRVEGARLDSKNRHLFRRQVLPHLHEGVRLALDLCQVRYVDGPGLGALLHVDTEATALGGEVRLFSLHPPVRQLLQKLRLHTRVHLHNAREEALRALEARAG